MRYKVGDTVEWLYPKLTGFGPSYIGEITHIKKSEIIVTLPYGIGLVITKKFVFKKK